ncbi:MAG TPA: hypothetical protein VJL81_04840 [Solirubrobacterales bacterium]|nr:hypothetical protein [Solirubrobacterales bacterium]
MKHLKALLLVPVLLALLAGTAFAKGTKPQAGLDPSFGRGGSTTVAVPKGEEPIHGFVVADDGRVYVLRASNLFAFEPDGKVARDFGKNGRITVKPAIGEGEPRALAVDSKGRVLVVGSTYLGTQRRTGAQPLTAESAEIVDAYTVRLLLEGSRDVTFGNGGEVDTDFGLPRAAAGFEKPSVWATSIAVDSQDRPVIGGAYMNSPELCSGYLAGTRAPFVGRLTASGAVDPTFAGAGHAFPAGPGEVTALAQTLGGGLATLSRGWSCGARSEEEPSHFSAFTETGEASPSLDPTRPSFYMTSAMTIDPEGRILVLQRPPLGSEQQGTLVRLQPNGDLDTSFGQNGGVAYAGGLSGLGSSFTVDAKSRPILAGGTEQIEVKRLRVNGKIDRGFSPNGRLTEKGARAEGVALDARGRIYTVDTVLSSTLKTGVGVQVTRFLPGS